MEHWSEGGKGHQVRSSLRSQTDLGMGAGSSTDQLCGLRQVTKPL